MLDRDEIQTGDAEYQDQSIKCVDCNENFIWTSGEQAFFHDKGLKNEPKRCKPCKQAKNERLAAITAAQTSGIRQRVEVSVRCAQCGQQTTVPFYPSQGRPVYCRSCFLAGRSDEDGEVPGGARAARGVESRATGGQGQRGGSGCEQSGPTASVEHRTLQGNEGN